MLAAAVEAAAEGGELRYTEVLIPNDPAGAYVIADPPVRRLCLYFPERAQHTLGRDPSAALRDDTETRVRYLGV